MTFLEYLERLAVTDREAKDFLDRSDRALLNRKFWGNLTTEIITAGRDEAYIHEVAHWFTVSSRAQRKLLGSKIKRERRQDKVLSS